MQKLLYCAPRIPETLKLIILYHIIRNKDRKTWYRILKSLTEGTADCNALSYKTVGIPARLGKGVERL